MKNLTRLRPVSLLAIAICVALAIHTALNGNWPLLVVLVIRPLVTGYVTRDQARWFRELASR